MKKKKIEEDNYPRINFRVSREFRQLIRYQAAKLRFTPAGFIRAAISYYVKEVADKPL